MFFFGDMLVSCIPTVASVSSVDLRPLQTLFLRKSVARQEVVACLTIEEGLLVLVKCVFAGRSYHWSKHI